MKKFFTANVALLIAANCLSQSAANTDQPVEKIDYLQKSKNQKTAAWVLLGVGAALDIAGIFTTASNANKEFNFTDPESVNHGGEIALYAAGTACLAGSLTLFIMAKKNKMKAMSITIDAQQFRQLKSNNLYTVHYPALTMRIRL